MPFSVVTGDDWAEVLTRLEALAARVSALEAASRLPPPPPVPQPAPTPQPPPPRPSPPPSGSGAHAYFDAHVSSPALWKAYSLRPRPGAPIESPYYERQLHHKRDGGYAYSDSAPLSAVYDPAAEAACITIPAFYAAWSLAEGVDATATRLVPASWSSAFTVGRQLRIDEEVMRITAADPSSATPRGVTVARGQYGTVAAPHAAGSAWGISTNSVPNGLRLPVRTVSGHRYAVIWDVYYTDSYLQTGLTNHKAFQLDSRKTTEQWLEVQTRFDGGAAPGRSPAFDPAVHVAGIEIRGYNYVGGPEHWAESTGDQFGPGVTGKEPIMPKVGAFNVWPNRWTRLVLTLDQRDDAYDLMNFWALDEQQESVQIYRDVPCAVRPSAAGKSVLTFWVELNTSTGDLRGRTTDFRDLVMYARNVMVLRDTFETAALLVRPVGNSPAASV